MGYEGRKSEDIKTDIDWALNDIINVCENSVGEDVPELENAVEKICDLIEKIEDLMGEYYEAMRIERAVKVLDNSLFGRLECQNPCQNPCPNPSLNTTTPSPGPPPSSLSTDQKRRDG
jgi:hypothetical protein